MLCYLSNLTRNYRMQPDPVVRHVNWEFYAILSGKVGRDMNDGCKPQLRGNYIWLIKPGQTYRWVSKPDAVRRVVFHFNHIPEILRQRFEKVDHLGCSLNAEERRRLAHLSSELMVYYLKPTEILDLVAQKVLCELSMILLKDDQHARLEPLKRKERDWVQRAEEWYQSHLKSRPTIDHVAMECGLSSSQLRRYFKKVYGVPPQLIFRRLRLYEAARLLANTDWTVDRIYPEAGFSSKVDFHRTFKEEYKTSPLKWRRHD